MVPNRAQNAARPRVARARCSGPVGPARCNTAAGASRRGTVLIMVIGVLSMLFIVGASLLIVARFERQIAETQAAGQNLEAVAAAVSEPILAQLREDVVGNDGVPYNRGWNNDEDSQIEDNADFPGMSGNGQSDENRIRSGDLLLSSIEPYKDVLDNDKWKLFTVSWPIDAPLSGAVPGINQIINRTISLTNSPKGDADGDGVRDSNDSLMAQLSGMFGGGYDIQLRVVPHGGMVRLDSLTHPSLLAQVIHPEDSLFHNDPYQLWGDPDTEDDDPIVSEGQLRRRFMLPADVARDDNGNVDFGALGDFDLRRLLPFTLGYRAAASVSKLTPHWWPADDEIVNGDDDWWQLRLTPGVPLTEQTDNGASDVYDRRRLITTENSDDILRPQRDEIRLREHGDPPTANDVYGELYYVVNPNPDGGTDVSFVPPAEKLPDEAYGLSEGNLAFNTPGLRTPFSLRDVLDPTGLGTYQRAVQLTAYFLAMIQHTNVTDPDDQLRIAAQLAVNTIDFADDDGSLDDDGAEDYPDQVSTYFAWPLDNPRVQVFGVEKQPFITEAYAKVVYSSVWNDTYSKWEWDPSTVLNESVFAVELYNPYDTPLDLDGYVLKTSAGEVKLGRDVDPAIEACVPGLEYIPKHSYVVIANRTDDPVVALGTQFVAGNLFPVAGPTGNLLRIDVESSVVLIRTSSRIRDLTGSGITEVEVDKLSPVGLGAPDDQWAAPAAEQTELDNWPFQPGGADKLVRDTSLQRHKERPDEPPRYWHFTLSRQMLLPLPQYEDPDGPSGPIVAPLGNDASRLPQHNLLGSNPMAGITNISNRELVEKEFLGIPITGYAMFPGFPTLTVTLEDKPPIAQFPIVTADRGIDILTKGCMSFPTTGTLLMVTRYAHTPDRTVSVAATMKPDETTFSPANIDLASMLKLDNGHLPIFDADQRCKDLDDEQGRLDVPWGQLVFDYFTALPIEELFRPIDLTWLDEDLGTMPLVDLSESYYKQAYATLFQLYAQVDQAEGASSPVGPKVQGRININVAPWWVLDGLPVLPDVEVGTYPLSGLPVPELVSAGANRRLDPDDPDYDPDTGDHTPIGLALMDLLTERPAEPKARTLNISPTLAKYMVSYRENRIVDGLPIHLTTRPGFVTVGALCDLVRRIMIDEVATLQTGATGGAPTAHTLEDQTLEQLRVHYYQTVGGVSSTGVRPFGYLGYLQMVAPIVRLQDWVTVKNHVFTIYVSMGDGSDPPLWLRKQVTVDRTRCLYSNDLPHRIAEIEPVGYYNAIDDE